LHRSYEVCIRAVSIVTNPLFKEKAMPDLGNLLGPVVGVVNTVLDLIRSLGINL